LVTRNIQTLKEILSELENEGRKIGLRINEEKTKYKNVSPIQAKSYLQDIIIDNSKFEGVDGFIYDWDQF
jgi:hypothetical protein